MISLLFLGYSTHVSAQCFAQIMSGSSTIPTGVVRPFCTGSGFNVTANVGHDENCIADVYVIIEARLKPDNSRFNFEIALPIERYFSNIQYAPTTGAPTLTEIYTMSESNRTAIMFRFRMTTSPVPGEVSCTFPFVFAPNFFFGDVPWRVWVVADEPDGLGNPQVPPVPPTNFSSEVLVGTILFDEPYYPIVGSQNVSDHYADMTSFWLDPNVNRTHSIMLLPGVQGDPPVLTVDVPEFILGFFGNPSDRGTLLMSPGAEVRVADGSTLAMGRMDMLTCINLVSKGIVVEEGGRLVQENCTFSDAEVAIDLKKGSAFESFFFLDFFNNYRGMRINNVGSASVPDILVKFHLGTDFTTNVATLKMPYAGMPAQSGSRGYGLEILSHPFITGSRFNFTGLNNGVRLYRSSLQLVSSTFTGIVSDVGSSVPHHGHAIWGIGLGTEELQCYGVLGSVSQDITTSEHGIYLNNMNAKIADVGIQAETGITLVNCKMKKIAITNQLLASKALTCRSYAIKTSRCLPLLSGLISNNFIQMNNPGNVANTGTGILLGEGATVGSIGVGWTVRNNNLDLNGTRWGIRGLGVNKSQFRSNDIEVLNNDHPDVLGMFMLNTTEMLANCNKVHTGASGSQAKGYLFTNVNQSGYTCNKTDNLLRGIEFSNLCEGTTLKGSELKNTPTGLLLRNNVALGTQGLDLMSGPVQDHGNRWESSVATHEAANFNLVNFSLFGVDPVENPEFSPASNWPNWFSIEIDPALSFSCAGFSCLSGYPSPENGRRLEQAIADGNIFQVGLPGVLPKMLENHLYAELQKNPAWADNIPLYTQFVQSKYGTTTDAFWQIQQGMDALNNRTNTEQTAIAAAEANIDTLRHDLYLMDSTYASGTTINQAHYIQKMATLSSTIASLQIQLDAVLSNRLTQAAQLLTQNAAIAAAQTWEQTAKQVNELEINLFVQDSVSSTQLSLLDALGMLCPETNGDAVFRAQVLFNQFEEKEFVPVCTGARGGSGERADAALKNAKTFSVSPNPSTGILNISGLDAATCLAEIFDISGRVATDIRLTDNTLDLTGLLPGLYLVRLSHPEKGLLGISKVVISQ